MNIVLLFHFLDYVRYFYHYVAICKFIRKIICLKHKIIERIAFAPDTIGYISHYLLKCRINFITANI